MIINLTIGNHTEACEYCPLIRHERTGQVCGHPMIEPRQTLYCNYTHTTDKYVEAPSRCLLMRHPVGGMRVEAVCR